MSPTELFWMENSERGKERSLVRRLEVLDDRVSLMVMADKE